jgi:DNA (cytosine-5)-methyltransferase 1
VFERDGSCSDSVVYLEERRVPDLKLVSSEPADRRKPRVAEFFAGIGLVRMGLEQAGFDVLWSNDIEADKRDLYIKQFDAGDDKSTQKHTFDLGDVGEVTGADMPDELSLAWASFPCTDLSVAGARAGLRGTESGTFWEFTRVLRELAVADKRPPVVALENVVGLATSHGGEDLAAVVRELNELGYSVDVLTIDARRFVPQSRPRLFIVGVDKEMIPDGADGGESALRPDWLNAVYADPTLTMHRAALPTPPAPKTSGFSALAETLEPTDIRWWDAARTAAFEASLSPVQRDRIEALRTGSETVRRTAYRRTRKGVPVWEVRADDIAGCLRTARGGSSKQAVVEIGSGRLRVRWMTGAEYARLQGAADYDISGVRDGKVLFGFGDAVCVPAVAWLGEHYLMPQVRAAGRRGHEWQPEVVAAAV